MLTMDEGPISFEDGVTAIMVVSEEMKQSLKEKENENDDIGFRVCEWQTQLEGVTQRLDFLLRLTLDSPGDQVRSDMFHHCAQRAVDVALKTLQHITDTRDGEVLDVQLPDADFQAVVARIAELGLILNGMKLQQKPEQEEDSVTKQIVELYNAYQRQVLRQRCKPPIAQLATWRSSHNHVQVEDEELQRPHVHAMTVILGQASALLHPLLLWKQQVPPNVPVAQMCNSAIEVLDEQAQSLTKRVCDWFHQDRKIDDWMSRSTEEGQNQQLDLGELDALLGEMSFGCEILARYDVLIQQADSFQTIVQKEMLPEWTWRYAALERFLSTQQWQHALHMACPVAIVIGTSIKVPSVVEDAQYLSRRALERASSTRSIQAMGTVAHSVSHDIWSTDNVSGGVYDALLHQKGCYKDEEERPKESNKAATPPVSSNSGNNTFASALLEALDDDLGPNNKRAPPPAKKPPSAPSSGGLLGGLKSLAGGQQQLLQIRLDTQLCNLNGIHSATVACSSLVQLLESLLEDSDQINSTKSSTAMIELAREELIRYNKSYQDLLNHMVRQVVLEWCGSPDAPPRRDKCLHVLRAFFQRENYELDATSFKHAESDDRLEHDMMEPLCSSPIVKHLDKCDSEVTTLLCRELSSLIADLVVTSLWEKNEGTSRRFNDWGALLLSKQVRLLSQFMFGLVERSSEDTYKGASIMDQWNRLSEVVTVLQLEKPSDFLAYQATCKLSPEELGQTLSLRVDFSSDAVLSTTQAYTNEKKAQTEKL